MAAMEISTRLRTKEFVAIKSGANASEKSTPRRSDHAFMRIGSGKNWIVRIALTLCS